MHDGSLLSLLCPSIPQPYTGTPELGGGQQLVRNIKFDKRLACLLSVPYT